LCMEQSFMRFARAKEQTYPQSYPQLVWMKA
jgi:hypothetical protein